MRKDEKKGKPERRERYGNDRTEEGRGRRERAREINEGSEG